MVPLDADVFGRPSEQFELLHLTLTRNENHRDREKGVKKKKNQTVGLLHGMLLLSALPPLPPIYAIA